jgi:GntR family transcriptional regulator
MADAAPSSLTAILRLDPASPAPKYQQIVEQVKALVASGALPAGAPLPSVRQLAGDLGVNVNTVVAAYRALESEQLVVLRRGSRAMIHPRLGRRSEPTASALERARELLRHVRTEALLLGIDLDTLRGLAVEVFADDPHPR